MTAWSPYDHTHDGTLSQKLSALYVDLQTAQTIAGNKTFSNNVTVNGTLAEGANRVYSAGNANLASTVASSTSFGQAAAVGTGTAYARDNHVHGTPATPATSVAGRTGAVTLTAADIGAGTFPGSTYTFSNEVDATVFNASNMHPSSARVLTQETTTSTTFVALTTAVSVSGVIVPPSGKVKITHGAQMSHSVATSTCLATVTVTDNTTSTVILAASDNDSAVITGGPASAFRTFMLNEVVALTAGHSLTVAAQYRIQGAGTGTFLRREVIAEPCI
jgi:hypothetical protein